MTEKVIQVFIDSVIKYFDHTSHKEVILGTPFLCEDVSTSTMDYTGIINISGPIQGAVYFTAPRMMVKHLLLCIGENDTSEDNILDLVGELANTISGNARSEFGNDFIISVPTVIVGNTSDQYLKNQRSYVIPLKWKSYSAAVVVSLIV